MAGTRVLGVDWASPTWVAAELDDGAFRAMHVETSLAHLLERHPDVSVVAIDMPIGLPDGAGGRPCDREARALVGPRGSSVFSAPPSAVLKRATYTDANAFSKKRYGAGVTAQAYALRDRICEVERAAVKDGRLIEVHPEVSFRELADAPLKAAKTSWDGQRERRRLLESAGVKVPAHIGKAGRVPVADVLDACVAAWSADRFWRGEAKPLPERTASGRRAVIWR